MLSLRRLLVQFKTKYIVAGLVVVDHGLRTKLCRHCPEEFPACSFAPSLQHMAISF